MLLTSASSGEGIDIAHRRQVWAISYDLRGNLVLPGTFGHPIWFGSDWLGQIFQVDRLS